MDGRKKLASLVLLEGVPIAQACRQLGVSRPTGHLWVKRAKQVGLASLEELPRRPRERAQEEGRLRAEEALLELKGQRPSWGAKKLLAYLWQESPPVCVRTADRILKRHGLVRKAGKAREEGQRFERAVPNELWQMDFKAVDTREYAALSVLDDCSRFLLGFTPQPDLRFETTFRALWELFGEHGLPSAILSDNGPPFHSTGDGPTPLEARLWLLGIATPHGRPRHPQTQGKVERFHLTAEEGLGRALRALRGSELALVMEAFRNDYNWQRPHEALGQRIPGLVYCPSQRKRPVKVPRHEIPEGSTSRKVDASGKFTFRGKAFRAGRGLIGQHIELREEEGGHAAFFAGVRLGGLDHLNV